MEQLNNDILVLRLKLSAKKMKDIRGRDENGGKCLTRHFNVKMCYSFSLNIKLRITLGNNESCSLLK